MEFFNCFVIFALICSHCYLLKILRKFHKDLEKKINSNYHEFSDRLTPTEIRVNRNTESIEVVEINQDKDLIKVIKQYQKYKDYVGFEVLSKDKINFLRKGRDFVAYSTQMIEVRKISETLSIKEIKEKVYEYQNICCKK